MRSLGHLLAGQRDPSCEVARRWEPALRADRVLRWGELQRHVAALRERIAPHPAGPWLLLTEDAYAFAVGLLALWHAGRHAISPPNRQLGTLRALQTRACGVLCDRPDWLPDGAALHPLVEGGPANPPVLAPLGSESIAVELFTSGTTGEEKPVTKRIRHLEEEVRVLGVTWDSWLGNASVFATASHQHLYGLLFGVLWPLCSGRVFQADHRIHASELVPRMREGGEIALASVPAHLKRLAAHADLASLRGRCRCVFSSGGPLPTDTAHRIARVLGRAPVEVLGSTETGGIGWRSQEPEQEECLWTPLPQVRLVRDERTGVARVRSPFVSIDEGAGFATGDRITICPDGRFRLEGRADRVVKVGERRLDLAQMESQLRGHPCVAEVALVLIRLEPEPRVAAAVVPTDRGWELVRREGRRGLRHALTTSLAEHWNPVLHPRFWRVVSRLPENALGKVTAETLRELFREDAARPARRERPEVLEELGGSDFRERLCRVPPDLSCFAGHFPGFPVVPAVLQLDWAMQLAEELLGAPFPLEEVESLRFRTPLRPGDLFRIRVRVSSELRLEFRIAGEEIEYARGRVRGVLRRPGP